MRAQLKWVVGLNTFESKPVTSSCICSAGVGDACVTKLTTDGISLFPHLGQLRVHVRK